MTRAEIPHLEIETLANFDRHIAGATSLENWTIQSVDLTEREHVFDDVNPAGALFLGCTMSHELEDELRDRGAMVFPRFPELPFNPYRGGLYRATDLYDAILTGGQYAQTFDAQVYGWYHSLGQNPPMPATLAMALHDHAVTDALDEMMVTVDPLRTVGIMGGHAMARGTDNYVGAARLGSQLALAGHTVMTGGGPGAMEAANLGAHLAGQYAEMSHALETLATIPNYGEETTAWAAIALEVVQNTRATGRSIGVPTWFYGHEPPNVFGTKIAKYFSNALREDALLQRCRAGLVYLPGAAGTVQEIFQAATRNYYAADPSLITPMVLVDVDHWTQKLPAWNLLEALGNGREMGDAIHLVETVDDAAEILLADVDE